MEVWEAGVWRGFGGRRGVLGTLSREIVGDHCKKMLHCLVLTYFTNNVAIIFIIVLKLTLVAPSHNMDMLCT